MNMKQFAENLQETIKQQRLREDRRYMPQRSPMDLARRLMSSPKYQRQTQDPSQMDHSHHGTVATPKIARDFSRVHGHRRFNNQAQYRAMGVSRPN